MPDIIPPIDGDEKFATASDLGIPPYNWIPPETPPLQITQNRRKQFPLKNLPDCPSLSRLEPEGRPNEEHLARKDADLKNWTVEGSCRFRQLKDIRIGAKSGTDFGSQEFLED